MGLAAPRVAMHRSLVDGVRHMDGRQQETVRIAGSPRRMMEADRLHDLRRKSPKRGKVAADVGVSARDKV